MTDNSDYYHSLIRYKIIRWEDEATGINSLSAPAETFKTVAEAAQHLRGAGDYVVAIDGIIRELNAEESKELTIALQSKTA